MKRLRGQGYRDALHVAPRAGAWIEAHRAATTWGGTTVAPRAGAWIEAEQKQPAQGTIRVAPRAGAWIEAR